MARINQGFLGNASGKLGNVVFSKWRDIQTARQYQPDIKDANSLAQQKQRNRMMALLQFLKPLNKTFIKFYNSNVCKESTPWAKAIKDNMKAISSDGCIIPEKITFGNPKFSPFEILETTYDPFIDLLRIKFKPFDISGKNEPFPYLNISVLGRYYSDPNEPAFDTRHLLKSCINLQFECISWDGQCEHTWSNYYSDGWVWFVYVDSDCMEIAKAPIWNASSPLYIKPIPLIEGFNNNFAENLVPVDAISWEYINKENKWYLVVSIDIKKTSIEKPENYTLIIWGLSFINGEYDKSEAFHWSLSEPYVEVEIGDNERDGSIICLYSVYTNEGQQVSIYNRFYIDSGTNGIKHNLHDQLFDSNYATPLSFQLNDNQTGFCGSIDELFGEFIQLYNQGVIYDHSVEVHKKEYILNIQVTGNGSIDVVSPFLSVENTYYFYVDDTAYITVMLIENYSFLGWSGEDVEELVKVSDTTYSIKMTRNRVLVAEFSYDSK